ncbi:MAG: DUF4834 family protein [Bacteroidetes bacterium]|nr:DUF4834 family protein [Bacteroidota bacterium]MBU1579448.1 DUF4834 family protein [Bacteroidota bacterium]MBU2556383.1 DUF4834 family protein [Bacteroidota bacterium]
METFFLFIFWVLFIFYAFRLFLRYVLPWIIGRYIRKMQDKMGQSQNKNSRQKEGEVKLNYKESEHSRVDPDIGEYVDFEEIKDNNSKHETNK